MDLLKRLEKATPRPGDTIDHYELVDELGQGGCGIVFRALNRRLGDDVALKVMLPQLAPAHLVGELFKRFEREASVLRTLRHPHVVRITDIGRTTTGFPYFVMELIEGPTLEQLLKAGPLDAERTARIAMQVLDTLELAHGSNVIHRDLKPSNIMLRNDFGSQDYVTVLDFGIAKVLDADSTMLTTSVSGTPWYMAPEQAKLADDLDGRVDVYSLGVIMAECLTARRVVDVEKPFSAAVVHASDEPLKFDPYVLESPLYPIIARATIKAREDRFADALAMRSALQEWLREPPQRSGVASAVTSSAAAPQPAPEPPRGSPHLERLPAPSAATPPAPPQRSRRSAALWGVYGTLGVALIVLLVALSSQGGVEETPNAARSSEGSGAPDEVAPESLLVTVAPEMSDALECRDSDLEACLRLANQRIGEVPSDEDWVAARGLLERACEGGTAQACEELGGIYREGRGVVFDVGAAAREYRRACELDGRFGCVLLGDMYLEGGVLGRDVLQAASLFERACEDGAAVGCNELGRLHEQGLDGVQNDRRAARLYEQACDGGAAAGCANLGLLVREGAGVTASAERAVRLFEQACDGGSPIGCLQLGIAYLDGRGVGIDSAQAQRYLAQACQGGLSAACARLDRSE